MVQQLLKDARIDRSSPEPVYRQITKHMISLVKSGAIGHGETLPSISETSRAFNVAPATVTKAIHDLKREGWVIARKGAGVYAGAGPVAAPAQVVDDPKTIRVANLKGIVPPHLLGEFLNQMETRLPGVRIVEDRSRPNVRVIYSPLLTSLSHELEDLSRVFLPRWGRAATDPVVAPFCHEGKLLLAEESVELQAVVLNREVLAEAGVPTPTSSWTLEEMTEIVKRVHAPERGRYGLLMHFDYLDFQYFLYHEGGNFFSDDGHRCTLDAPQAVRAMQRMNELTRYAAPYTDPSAVKVFARTGSVGMVPCPTRFFSVLRNVQWRDYALLCLPDYRRGIVPAEVDGLAVTRGSAAREACIQFLDLLLEHNRPSGAWPLAVQKEAEDLSAITQPYRDSLPYSRHFLSNVPDAMRSIRHDAALQFFAVQCRSMASGPAEAIPERMHLLAEQMTAAVCEVWSGSGA